MTIPDKIADIINIIHNNDSFLLLAHKSADGDSIGSMIALGRFLKDQLGKEVHIPFPTEFPPRYRFLEEGRVDIKDIPTEDFITIILDCSSLSRLDDGGYFGDKLNVDVLIDHHEGDPEYDGVFNGAIWQDTSYPAVGMMIYELLELMKAEITPIIAEGLYCAILTDTGQFAFSGTTSDSLRIAAELVDKGASPSKIAREVYWNYPRRYIENMRIALNSMNYHYNDSISVIKMTRDKCNDKRQLRETEGIIDLGIIVEGVLVAVLMREMEPENIRVSLRSRGNIDVSEIARKYGGGGRFNASGCNIKVNIEDAESLIIQDSIEAINKARNSSQSTTID